MKIGDATIGKLARMVCGDKPYDGSFPYRSSSYLTMFFEGIDLDYVHDGSTRFFWVRWVLLELNTQPETSEELPSTDLVRVIEYLVDTNHFGGAQEQHEAIQAVNEALQRYKLAIHRDDRAGNVQLRSAAGGYVSTAVPRPEARHTITFSPGVFSVPEKEQDSKLVAVMMPFAEEFTSVYEAIRGACMDAGLSCNRADDIWEDSTFIQDVFSLIFQSSIVIVDFSGRNPNVMYETRISHTLGKNVVPLTQHIEDIPSDLKTHRALKYLANEEGLRDLRKHLATRLRTLHERQMS